MRTRSGAFAVTVNLHAGHGARLGRTASTRKPPSERRARRQPAADHGGSLAHAGQPVSARAARFVAGWPGAVVAYPHMQSVLAVVKLHVDGRTRRVAAGVGQRLLHDAVRGELDARVERAPLCPARSAGRPESEASRASSSSSLSCCSPGCGRRVGFAGGVLPQYAQQPAHLGQRRPGGVADRGEPSRALGRQAGCRSLAASAWTAIMDM